MLRTPGRRGGLRRPRRRRSCRRPRGTPPPPVDANRPDASVPACLAATGPALALQLLRGAGLRHDVAGVRCCGNYNWPAYSPGGEDCVAAGMRRQPCCLTVTAACTGATCCGNLVCGTTSLGRVCCGNAGTACSPALDSTDCCGVLVASTASVETPPGARAPARPIIPRSEVTRPPGGDAEHRGTVLVGCSKILCPVNRSN